MDNCSYFIDNIALFGSYPTKDEVSEYESVGVRYFVDLTCDNEWRITPYKTRYTHIRYPIKDRYIPTSNETFAAFIIHVCDIIASIKHSCSNEKVFVHCKAGHGRSGVVVACILVHLYKFSAERALLETAKCHQKRKCMKQKWREIGAPQTCAQKLFVRRFCEPIVTTSETNEYDFFAFVSPFSRYTIKMNDLMFSNFDTAYKHIAKSFELNDFASNIHEHDPLFTKIAGTGTWDECKWLVVLLLCQNKVEQHETVRRNLMKSGLRPIVYKFKKSATPICENDDLMISLSYEIVRDHLFRDEIYPF